MINYNNKQFKVIENAENGDITTEQVFHYKQTDNVLSCSYKGDNIQSGHLLGVVNEKGVISMQYHQINRLGEMKTGQCISTPEILPNGKIILHERWEWTNGDLSKGNSILEEV